jgi:ABC-type multidrug transport system fused ATPase/permease subunit
MNEIIANLFDVKLYDGAVKIKNMCNYKTLGNPAYIASVIIHTINTVYMRKIREEHEVVDIITNMCLRNILSYMSWGFCSFENNAINDALLRSNEFAVRKIDLQFQHYHINAYNSSIMHNYYLYSFEHHVATTNIIRDLSGFILHLMEIFASLTLKIQDKLLIVAFVNSTFNVYMNSIERIELDVMNLETNKLDASNIITDFILNQNIIYNCSQEEPFIAELNNKMDVLGKLNVECNDRQIMTNEYNWCEIVYSTKLHLLKCAVNLSLQELIMINQLERKLWHVAFDVIQLSAIYNKLQSLNMDSLDAYKFNNFECVYNVDYKRPLFTIKKMSFSYTKETLFKVHNKLVIPSRKWIHFKGNSGTGKTTFIQLLVKLISNNDISFFQHTQYDLHAIREHVIYVKSSGDVFDDKTVMYNVTFGLDEVDERMIKRYFKLFQLGSYSIVKNQIAGTLSTGEKQRIRIIHTILTVINKKHKRVLILDEVTSNVDESIECVILDELRRVQLKYSLSVIHISHFSGHVRYSDMLMEINKKRVSIAS